MTVKERYDGIIGWFRNEMPEPKTELHYETPFQLLVAVILSAQCTDKRVNIVTPPLFEAFPTAEAMARATEDTLFPYVRSVSYPNNKTRSLLGMARRLTEEFGGEVPADIDALLSLPGVGRKTANVILSVVFGNGGRHPRIQSQRTHRTHHRKQIAACHGAMSCEAYTGRSDRQGTPLAHTPWPLRVQGTPSPLP